MRQSVGFALVILLCAFALRLYQINAMSLRADEASNLFFATQDLNAVVKQLVADDPHPPLYFFILHYWIALASNSELALRFLGVLAGTLVVALTYWLGQIVSPLIKGGRGDHLALISAALAAINPSLIWDAQDAHLYPLLVFYTALSSAVFLLTMQHSSLARWALYISASALALYTHYIAAFILVAHGVLAALLYRHRLFNWIVAQMVIGGIFLPWFWLSNSLLRGYQLDFYPPANIFEILSRSLQAFTVGRVDSRLMPPMIARDIGTFAPIGMLVICLYGLWGWRTNRAMLTVVPIFLFVPFVCFAFFAFLRFSIYDERYVLYSAPIFLIVMAQGLIALSQLPKGRIWFGVAMFSALVISASSLNNYWHVPAYAKSPDWRASMERIFSDAQPGDVLVQNYPDPALPYYLQDRIPRVLLPRASGQSGSDLSADLARLAEKYSRIWFQPAPGSAWDTEGLVAEWMLAHAHKQSEYQFRGVRLELYIPQLAR